MQCGFLPPWNHHPSLCFLFDVPETRWTVYTPPTRSSLQNSEFIPKHLPSTWSWTSRQILCETLTVIERCVALRTVGRTRGTQCMWRSKAPTPHVPVAEWISWALPHSRHVQWAAHFKLWIMSTRCPYRHLRAQLSCCPLIHVVQWMSSKNKTKTFKTFTHQTGIRSKCSKKLTGNKPGNYGDTRKKRNICAGNKSGDEAPEIKWDCRKKTDSAENKSSNSGRSQAKNPEFERNSIETGGICWIVQLCHPSPRTQRNVPCPGCVNLLSAHLVSVQVQTWSLAPICISRGTSFEVVKYIRALLCLTVWLMVVWFINEWIIASDQVCTG